MDFGEAMVPSSLLARLKVLNRRRPKMFTIHEEEQLRAVQVFYITLKTHWSRI